MYIEGKCGCPDCKKGDEAPKNRNGWKSRKNSHGNYYGSKKNPRS